MARAIGAGLAFAAIAAAALFVLPPLLLLLLFVLGPALAALAFSTPRASRERFTANGSVAATMAGLTSAVWIALRADDETSTLAVAIGAVLSFFLLMTAAGVAVHFLARLLATEATIAARDAEHRHETGE
ncbi:MAG: hypothetical protein IT304_04300 [Dehalococcoidia bacterium]|nr:hypothetical protein [Dehalococcoidia bacterium]